MTQPLKTAALLADPWGEAMVAGTLDRDRPAAVRLQLPALAQRRL